MNIYKKWILRQKAFRYPEHKDYWILTEFNSFFLQDRVD